MAHDHKIITAPKAEPYQAFQDADGTWSFRTATGSSSGYRHQSHCQKLADTTKQQDEEAWKRGGNPFQKLLNAYFGDPTGAGTPAESGDQVHEQRNESPEGTQPER
jgi:hypothetical protein